MTELTTNAKSLLDAAKRTAAGPSDEAIERMERQVLLAVGASATATAAGAAAVKGASLWTAAVGKIVLGTALLVVGGIVGAAIVWHPQAVPQVVVAQVPAFIPSEVEGPALTAPPLPAPAFIPSGVEGPALKAAPLPAVFKAPPLPEPAFIPSGVEGPALNARPPKPSSPALPPPVAGVERPAPKPVPLVLPTARELAVLRSALDRIDALEWNEGLAFLDRHDAEFSEGALRDEAGVLRVLALCGLEQVSAAFDVAAQVRARSPKSPALARLSGSCVSP